MIIITYVTHSDGYFPVLKNQCEKLKLNLITLGFGKKWIGFYNRFIVIYDYIKKLDENEIIIIIDGFDTIPMENESQILLKYKSFNKPVVWGIENDNSTLVRTICLFLYKNFLFGNVDGLMVNGGSYMGQVKYIKIIYENIFKEFGLSNTYLDDQVIINKIGNNDWFKDIVAFDINNIIFYNSGLLLSEKYKLINPSFISVPGKTNANKLVKELGYENLILPDLNNFVLEENIIFITITIVLIILFLIKIFIL